MSRSARNLAIASSSGTSPFIGTSELDVTMMPPWASGADVVDGRKDSRGSTPTGTTVSAVDRGTLHLGC
jgi:hypothetical protein